MTSEQIKALPIEEQAPIVAKEWQTTPQHALRFLQAEQLLHELIAQIHAQNVAIRDLQSRLDEIELAPANS